MRLGLAAFVIVSATSTYGYSAPMTEEQRQAARARLDAEAAKRNDEQRRAQACRELPQVAAQVVAEYLAPSAAEHGGEAFAQGIPMEPSDLHQRFAGLNDRVTRAEAAGCADYRSWSYTLPNGATTSFGEEWTFQQAREAQRKSALATAIQRDADAKKAAEEQLAKERAEGAAAAAKKGYKNVVVGIGLAKTIEQLVAGTTTPDALKKTAIELIPSDAAFTALQVVSAKQVIYTSSSAPQVVMLKNYSKTVLEGSSLYAVANRYVVIKGVTSYRSIAGPRQAIVVEPAF